ncbi:MAG: SDR family NAD(P)-dependent oxidoreductase [Acetobacteraceae bacterium]
MTDPAHPSLRDRVVIVTGGARGIGREMALALLKAGARVAVTAARSPEDLAAIAAEAEQFAGPGRLIALRADVTSREDCAEVVARTLSAFGALHALVNNAGRGMLELSPVFNTAAPRFWEVDADAWERIIRINLVGAFFMAHAAAPHLVAQGFGRIVNVSTSPQTMVRKGYSPYGPSKAGLEAATSVWAKDLEGTGVTCNVILPGGATDTKFIPGSGPDRRGADGMLLPAGILNPVILWLLSDASNGITASRFVGRLWDASLPPDEAAAKARQPQVALPTIL